MKYLLDTNVLSEAVKSHPDANVMRWNASISIRDTFISALTIGEIKQGIAKRQPSKRTTALQRWLDEDILVRFRGRILPVDLPIALEWGALMGKSQQAGDNLPIADALIAATALYHHLIISTRNTKDFERVNVAIINPWEFTESPANGAGNSS